MSASIHSYTQRQKVNSGNSTRWTAHPSTPVSTRRWNPSPSRNGECIRFTRLLTFPPPSSTDSHRSSVSSTLSSSTNTFHSHTSRRVFTPSGHLTTLYPSSTNSNASYSPSVVRRTHTTPLFSTNTIGSPRDCSSITSMGSMNYRDHQPWLKRDSVSNGKLNSTTTTTTMSTAVRQRTSREQTLDSPSKLSSNSNPNYNNITMPSISSAGLSKYSTSRVTNSTLTNNNNHHHPPASPSRPGRAVPVNELAKLKLNDSLSSGYRHHQGPDDTPLPAMTTSSSLKSVNIRSPTVRERSPSTSADGSGSRGTSTSPEPLQSSNSSNNSSAPPRWSSSIGVSRLMAPNADSSSLTSSKTTGGPVSGDRQNGGLVGLNNLGNTCFMNSIIQCLSNTQPLLDYCLSGRYMSDLNKSSSMRGALFTSYANMMKELWNADMFESSTSPYQFKTQIQRFAPRFVGYAQQDSQELLRYLLEGLHMEVNRVIRRARPSTPDYTAEDKLSDRDKADLYWKRYLSMDNSEIVDENDNVNLPSSSASCTLVVQKMDPFDFSLYNQAKPSWVTLDLSHLFVGQLMSTLECMECGFKSTTFDPFWDLSLPIPKKSNVTLMDCLRLFTSKEDLDGNERPTCGRCKVRRRCSKSFSIHKFPRILVIHLKRFSGERFRSKMSVLVDYPLTDLHLSEFASPSCQQLCTRYNLYGVSNHTGSVYTGHYTAACKHHYRGGWVEYNDSRVRANINTQSVVSPEGYVLFYELAT